MQEDFRKIIKTNNIPGNKGVKVEIGGKSIALFRVKDKVYAIHNTCPHQGADLADGQVKDLNVICPLHQWSFNLETGAFSGNESVRIPTYKVKTENENVYILWRD